MQNYTEWKKLLFILLSFSLSFSLSFRCVFFQMTDLNKIVNVWKTADAVTFDVDSTVTTEEGIDELANFCGKGKQIAEL